MLSFKLEQTYENILYHFQNMLSQIWEKVCSKLEANRSEDAGARNSESSRT
jgi:hypothetical protein